MKIKWDEVGKRLYETGVDHGVLFPMGEDNAYGKGVPWYGLSAGSGISVTRLTRKQRSWNMPSPIGS